MHSFIHPFIHTFRHAFMHSIVSTSTEPEEVSGDSSSSQGPRSKETLTVGALSAAQVPHTITTKVIAETKVPSTPPNLGNSSDNLSSCNQHERAVALIRNMSESGEQWRVFGRPQKTIRQTKLQVAQGCQCFRGLGWKSLECLKVSASLAPEVFELVKKS